MQESAPARLLKVLQLAPFVRACVPCRAVPCRAVPRRAVPCRAVPRRAVPRRAMPCVSARVSVRAPFITQQVVPQRHPLPAILLEPLTRNNNKRRACIVNPLEPSTIPDGKPFIMPMPAMPSSCVVQLLGAGCELPPATTRSVAFLSKVHLTCLWLRACTMCACIRTCARNWVHACLWVRGCVPRPCLQD